MRRLLRSSLQAATARMICATYTMRYARNYVVFALCTHVRGLESMDTVDMGSEHNISSEAALPSITASLQSLCDDDFTCCDYIVNDAYADEGGKGCLPKGSQAGLRAATGRAFAAQQRAAVLSSQHPLRQRTPQQPVKAQQCSCEASLCSATGAGSHAAGGHPCQAPSSVHACTSSAAAVSARPCSCLCAARIGCHAGASSGATSASSDGARPCQRSTYRRGWCCAAAERPEWHQPA